ncbi:MAG: cadmium-translocating P-type ATPase [Methanothrix sp.]|jgi:Cu2+-exporting ATPase|nr:cadmium-translocating P-type ATPase [Methanothrix sp.]
MELHHQHDTVHMAEEEKDRATNGQRRSDHVREIQSSSSHDKMPQAHQGHGAHGDMLQDFKRRLIVSIILTVPVLVLSHHIQLFFGFSLRFPGSEILLFLLASVVYLYGGYPFFVGFKDELKKRLPGMMTLVAVAITVAYLYSSAVVFGLSGMDFFWELVTLIDIMLLGHLIEMRSTMGASRALEELAKILPSQAHLVKDGETYDVNVSDLNPEDRVLVKPGEKIPVDGQILEGATDVNESMLTGESQPVIKKVGGEVMGGSINGSGSITVGVKKTGRDTYLSQVIELVKHAQESRSRTQNLANRAAFVLTVVALAVGSITFAGWLIYGKEFAFAIERAVTVMVTACPHALGLAIPLVVAVSTSIAAKSGLLVRDRQAFESAKDIKAVVFDKTGTLTEGRFGLTDILPLEEKDIDRILAMASSLEGRAEHPIARALIEIAEARGLPIYDVEHFHLIPGEGIEGQVEGRHLKIVSPNYLRQHSMAQDAKLEGLMHQGKTVVVLLEDDRPLGALALADVVRKESREAVDALKSMGIRCMMLTGDNRYVAEAVSKELGLDEFVADVLPGEKAEAIRKIQKEFSVVMVGDGVNDAPALAQADVGIAIGAGTQVAIQTADIVLVRNNPGDVVNIIKLSRKTYSKMLQNLFWATGYNVIAIPLAAGVLYSWGILLSPAAGALLMSLSTVIVAANAKTLKYKSAPLLNN